VTIRINRRYESGEIVVRSWWAWWPAKCQEYEDDRVVTETRWLERVYVVSEYQVGYMDEAYWKKIAFTTKEDYEAQLEKDQKILDREVGRI